jgi:hypothetical protein
MHTIKPLVPEPGSLEFENAIKKLKRYKSPGTKQIPEELMQAEGNTLSFENKKELTLQWNESTVVPIYRKTDNSDNNNRRGTSLLLTTNNIYPMFLSQS